jgi:hypothetical protein
MSHRIELTEKSEKEIVNFMGFLAIINNIVYDFSCIPSNSYTINIFTKVRKYLGELSLCYNIKVSPSRYSNCHEGERL